MNSVRAITLFIRLPVPSLAFAGLAIFSSCAALAQSSPSSGQQALYTSSLAATCANCHGTQGRAVEGSSITSLAGLDKS